MRDAADAAQDFAEGGIVADRVERGELAPGIDAAPRRREHERARLAHARLRWRGRSGAHDLLPRPLAPSGKRQGLREAKASGNEPLVHSQRIPKLPNRLVESPREDQKVADVHRKPEVEGAQRKRLPDQRESAIGFAAHHQQVAVPEVRGRVTRIERQRALERARGGVEIPVEEEPDRALRRLHLRAVRVERERLRQMLAGGIDRLDRRLDAVEGEQDPAVSESHVRGGEIGRFPRAVARSARGRSPSRPR